MIIRQACLVLCLLSVTQVQSENVSDFLDMFWSGIRFVYHSSHDLFFVIDDNANKCYFNHVTNSTVEAFKTCHRQFLEKEIYDRIMWADTLDLKPSSLNETRSLFADVLADFTCANSQIYIVKSLFGDDYIPQCAEQDQAVIG